LTRLGPVSIVILMGIKFPATGPSRFTTSVVGAVVGVLLTAPIALLFTGSEAVGMAWATVPVAGLAGWRLAAVPFGPERSQRILRAALAFGGIVAFGGVLLFILVTMAAALVPGSTVARPESPIGYVIMLVLTLVAMTPVVAVPAGLIGLAWAGLVRRLGGAAQPV
jgi:hypothetical protein